MNSVSVDVTDSRAPADRSSRRGGRGVPVLGAVALSIVVLGLFLNGAWLGWRGSRPDVGKRKILHYVDPMNPAHTSSEPGFAPCGMKLEPVYADEDGQAADPKLPTGTVKVGPQRQQLVGVRVTPVEAARPFTCTLRAPGRVAVDETLLYRLTAPADGWLRRPLSKTTGSLVKKDEVLATFYTREFLPAVQAYFAAMDATDRYEKIRVAQAAVGSTGGQQQPRPIVNVIAVKVTRTELARLGVSQHQLAKLDRTRQYDDEIEVVAPATGLVISRSVSNDQQFARGADLLTVAALHRVWVLADLYEHEAQHVRPGDRATVFHPFAKKTLQATVSEVLPVFDATSRTLKVRLELDNPGYLLRPDMFVDVEFALTLPPALTVPADAVLDSGLKCTVFVDRGNGFFEPRRVETGWRLSDRMEITSGLKPGEKIVVSGNFLLDSESRMKLAAQGMFGEVGDDPVCGMKVDQAKAEAAGLTSLHRGETFHFCAPACKTSFDGDPTRHLARGERSDRTGPGAVPGEAMPATPASSTAAAVVDLDLICAMTVQEARARRAGLVSEYRGKTYLFCGPGCKRRFDEDPERIVTGAGRASSTSPRPPGAPGPDHQGA
ncbi:MAG: efflux RND transporter periplasmic adaptor subunit, partial [Candidatus Riflebacteria bacterium]|nr:efflux RND transporter periplasmic adaptor subunit [Candidatus Riflebacteria bacterium]